MKFNRSIGFLSFLATMSSYAAPLTIVPQRTLPTSVNQGSSVNAYYTIINNTLSPRTRNFVKWFPPNVTQVLEPTDPTVCSRSFNLGPHGSINQSCTLILKISGVVRRNDSNPQHHLFVCFPGGKTCAGPTPENSLNVRIATGPATAISTSVGFYQAGMIIAPLAFISSNNGATWSASVPPDTGLDGGAILSGVGCDGLHCSAVGNYGDSNGNELPLFYSTLDGGVTWSEPSFFSLQGIPMPALTEIQTVAISCSGSKCSTVGSYQDNSNRHQPLSYSSSDYGVTWSQPYFPSKVGFPVNQSRFLGAVSCTDTTCVAGGFYNNALNDRQPLFYRSTNNGVSWSAPIIPATTGLPAGNGGAKIVGVSCSGSNCTAVGVVEDPVLPGRTIPFSYLSTNGGVSWGTAHLFSLTTLPVGNRGAYVNGVSCVESKCSAVGYYKDAGNTKHAVYYTSTNRGVSWSKTLFPPTTGLPMNAGSELLSVSCINNICSAVGSYFNLLGVSSLTYQSLNNGLTWTIFLPTLSPLPVGVNNRLLGVGGSQSGVLQT